MMRRSCETAAKKETMNRYSLRPASAVLVSALCLAGFPSAASAKLATYPALKERGYATSKLVQNPHSNQFGWFMTGGAETYFCPMLGGWFHGGPTGVGIFSPTGPMPLVKGSKIYLLATGYGDTPVPEDAPELGDLKGGRPRFDKDVKYCETWHGQR